MVHWPDTPPVRVERFLNMERGDVGNVSIISLGSHAGTYMDAPLGFVRGAEGMDRMPLDATIGRVRVIEIQGPTSVKPDELGPHEIGRGARILFKTRNSSLSSLVWWTRDFIEDFVYISQEAACDLADGDGAVARAILQVKGNGIRSARRNRASAAVGMITW